MSYFSNGTNENLYQLGLLGTYIETKCTDLRNHQVLKGQDLIDMGVGRREVFIFTWTGMHLFYLML